MMKRKLLGLLFVFGTAAYSQVGIGTLAPNGSAMLEVASDNKGILIPKVSLKGTTDAVTIKNGNIESLLVYNTQLTADVKPGYYYWFNNKWNKIAVTDDMTTGSTTNVLEASANTLKSNVNGVSATAPIIESNVLSAAGSQLVSKVNNVSSTALDLTPAVKAATTHSLTVSGGVLTSTVNGISPTAAVLASAGNGLSAAAGNVKLGGPLTAATVLTTTASETLALLGLKQTATAMTDNIVVADGTTGVLKTIPGSQFISAISAKTSDYTVLPTDETILADASSGDVVITLPSAALSLGKKFNIKKIDTSDNYVKLTSAAGTIDTVSVVSGGVWLQSWTVQSDGANWFIINRS